MAIIVCAVCVQEVSMVQDEVANLLIAQLPHSQALKPQPQLPAYSLFDSLLLELAGTYEQGGETWCHVCRWSYDGLKHIEDNHPYKYSLANNLWISTVLSLLF